jgi:hypothetical protein
MITSKNKTSVEHIASTREMKSGLKLRSEKELIHEATGQKHRQKYDNKMDLNEIAWDGVD